MRSTDLLTERIRTAAFERPQLEPDDWDVVDADVDDALRAVMASRDEATVNSVLNALGQLQEVLAKLTFKFDVQLPPRLRSLVREFDRSDDEDLRKEIVERIKKGEFLSG
jgi:peptidoglycan hydrolase-like protein with peptidoglycan-binding domain